MISYTSWAFGAYSLARKLCTKLIVKQRIISGEPPPPPPNMALGNTRELGATPGTHSPFPPVALSRQDVWEYLILFLKTSFETYPSCLTKQNL